MGTRLPQVDAYIETSAPFAQPILTHVRDLVHASVPEVEEAIKWSMPFFTLHGIILAHMAAFKQHCSVGVWKGNLHAAGPQRDAKTANAGMGNFGKLQSVDDLPPRREFQKLLKAEAAKIADGTRTKSMARPAKQPKPEAEVPAALAAALRKNKTAGMNFKAMSASCRRDYCEWIAEAKRDETRDKRLAQAMEWIAEGKTRHWKYQNC